MKGVLGEHIGESEDVRKIVLATVTAWKDSSTQRYLKGIVDTINAIHKDDPARNPPPKDRGDKNIEKELWKSMYPKSQCGCTCGAASLTTPRGACA